MTTGKVITFYSYKGGVGRSMALANVAVLLAMSKKRVLVVDWDLEAPGIEKYFDRYIDKPLPVGPGIVELMTARAADTALDWRTCVVTWTRNETKVDILSAGRRDESYAGRLAQLDWTRLFADHDLGRYLETLRDEWSETYDYVLVDSRTGITDTGGICTIHLPDVVVALFTANEQSLNGVVSSMNAARARHATLPVDRSHLLVVPVPARDESQSEHAMAAEWRKKFAAALAELYADWLPEDVPPLEALRILRVPYKAYWSFGEPLPVIEDGTTEPGSIGYAYALLASLIECGYDWEAMNAGRFAVPRAVRVEPGGTKEPTKPPTPDSTRGRRIAMIAGGGVVVAIVGVLAISALKGAKTDRAVPPPPPGVREKLVAAARTATDPLEQVLLLREVPANDFDPTVARQLLRGVRVPTAVFRPTTGSAYVDARFSPDGEAIVLRSDDAVVVGRSNGYGRTQIAAVKPVKVAFFAGPSVITSDSLRVSSWNGDSDPTAFAPNPPFLDDAERHPDVSSTVAFFSSGITTDAAESSVFVFRGQSDDPIGVGRVNQQLMAVGRTKAGDIVYVDKSGEIQRIEKQAVSSLYRPRWIPNGTPKSPFQAVVTSGWTVVFNKGTGLLAAWHSDHGTFEPEDLDAINDVAANDEYVVAATDSRVHVYPHKDQDFPLDINGAYAVALAGDRLIVAQRDGAVTLRKLEAQTAQTSSVISLPLSIDRSASPPITVTELVVSDDLRRALAITSDGNVTVWSLDAKPVIDGLQDNEMYRALQDATSACLSADRRFRLLGEDDAPEKARACEEAVAKKDPWRPAAATRGAQGTPPQGTPPQSPPAQGAVRPAPRTSPSMLPRNDAKTSPGTAAN